MTRFAPSPTGDMHIGNMRAAILNYLYAKQQKTKFVLRIEDTDNNRNLDGKEEEIKSLLKIFGLEWDFFYIQSKHLKIHRQMALRLIEQGKAFACFCTNEELKTKKEKAKELNKPYRYDGTCKKLSNEEVLNNNKPFVIRLKKPNNSIAFDDFIKGHLSFEPDDIDDFVIMRIDKTPTYNFACAIDDMNEGISCIIRGEDHTSNTPKQEHIRHSLGYDARLSYAHLPIILNEHGQKMSKREAHSSVKNLLELGILPEAIMNYLILLGNKTPKEIFSLQEAIEFFDIKNISKSPARFDIKKLLQINRIYIKNMQNTKLADILGFDDFDIDLDLKENFALLAKLYLQESSTIKELKEKIQNIFNKNYINEDFKIEINLLKNLISQTKYDDYNDFKAYLMSKSNLKGKSFFIPLRLLLTKSSHGPELSDLYPILKDFIKYII